VDYYDLGTYSREITTESEKAQVWFDRGLVWVYGYHHEEAIHCFRQALEEDPHCVFAHWGIAYAAGPNYNKQWADFEAGERQDALELARECRQAADAYRSSATAVETALLDALAHRYPDNGTVEDISPWNDAYANAMREVYHRHGDDLDVCCLFTESLLNRTPWQLWDLASGEPMAGASTEEAMVVLERAFAEIQGAWDHPGLLHMYIHLMEMSPHPERALRHGDRLSALVPDAGHLLHMGTHIDVLCGEYANVVLRNQAAIVADRKYLERAGADNFYTVYRCHNYHFKVYGAMFLGQPEPALEAAEELIDTLPESILHPMADWFEGFVPIKQHVLIRFGLWQDILAQPLPEDRELYCVTTAMMRYARTVALANSRNIDAALAEREQFYAAREKVPDSRMLFNNTCVDILAIAEQMLLGELEYHRGNRETAFDYLRRAIQLDDELPYDEPWGWMQPARHALGALLLEQNRYAEAEAIYRADLGLDATLSRACQHPGNIWSLHGLAECLKQRGETLELPHIQLQLERAQARAAVTVRASCYCRGVASD
jgi:tetratricopeptide (TPR) repeat protein